MDRSRVAARLPVATTDGAVSRPVARRLLARLDALHTTAASWSPWSARVTGFGHGDTRTGDALPSRRGSPHGAEALSDGTRTQHDDRGVRLPPAQVRKARRARVGIASSGSENNGSAMGETSLGGMP